MPTNAQVHGPALRATFLLAFDNFATDPSEVATLPEVGNVRYARELLGLLVTAGLLGSDFTNDEPDAEVWQVTNPGTYDSATREQAEAVIDEFLAVGGYTLIPTTKAPKATKRSAPATKRNPAGLPLCLCGCGTPGKSDYRPGHDARHAGDLARAVMAGEMTLAKATGSLSAPLAAKVAAQVARGNNKAAGSKPKGAPTPKRPRLNGATAWVKVGRWIKTGTVTSTTVNSAGLEDANSEVCCITYLDAKGQEQTVDVDTQAMDGKWGMGAAPTA